MNNIAYLLQFGKIIKNKNEADIAVAKADKVAQQYLLSLCIKAEEWIFNNQIFGSGHNPAFDAKYLFPGSA